MNVLFFAPFTGIVQHAAAEVAVAHALQRHGLNVKAITCGSLLKGQCITLSARGLQDNPQSKKVNLVCNQCTSYAGKFFPGSIKLTDLYTQNNDAIEKMVCEVTPENYFDFQFKSIPFGRIAAYQNLLKFKKNQLNIRESEWPVFKTELINTLKTYFAIQEYLSKNTSPDIVLVYNTLYSINAIARILFSDSGSTVYSLHAGPNLHHFYDTLLIAKGDTFQWGESNRLIWRDIKDKVIGQSQIRFVEDHFHALLRGTSVFAYSTATAIEKASPTDYFKIKPHQKTILVAMSSNDENFAGLACGAFTFLDDCVFSSQAQWVNRLISFARLHPELFFIFRIHPRELPNKREQRTSEHAGEIFTALSDLPENCALNIPKDGYSIHQIMSTSNLVLTAWSSSSIEATLLGLPVLAYSASWQDCPPDMFDIARNETEYFEKILELVHFEYSIQRSIRAFRWLSLIQDRNCIKLTAAKKIRTKNGNGFFRSSILKVIRKFYPAFGIENMIRRVENETNLAEMLEAKSDNPINWIQPQNDEKIIRDEAVLIRKSLSTIGFLAFGNEEKWPLGFKKMIHS